MIAHAQLPEVADMIFADVCIPEADELTQLTAQGCIFYVIIILYNERSLRKSIEIWRKAN